MAQTGKSFALFVFLLGFGFVNRYNLYGQVGQNSIQKQNVLISLTAIVSLCLLELQEQITGSGIPESSIWPGSRCCHLLDSAHFVMSVLQQFWAD